MWGAPQVKPEDTSKQTENDLFKSKKTSDKKKKKSSHKKKKRKHSSSDSDSSSSESEKSDNEKDKKPVETKQAKAEINLLELDNKPVTQSQPTDLLFDIGSSHSSATHKQDNLLDLLGSGPTSNQQ